MAIAEAGNSPGRDTCYRCFRPTPSCYCQKLTRIDNKTRIVILQHPRERNHPLGTARLAHLSLANSELLIDYSHRYQQRPPALPADAGLLYPGADATPLSSLGEHEKPSTLIVLDGTWHHAHYFFRDYDWLRNLPRFAIQPAKPSNYRIRREPAAHCVSTVEAISLALRELEPDLDGLGDLLGGFDAMIDTQIAQIDAHRGTGERTSRYKKRRVRPRQVTKALLTAPRRLVVVYADYTTLPGETEPMLLTWSAYRPETGEYFGTLVQHEVPLSSAHYEHLDVQRRDFEHAPPLGALRARWGAYTQDDDIFVAWNSRSLSFLRTLQPSVADFVTLRTAYLNLGRHRGGLDSIIDAEHLRPAQRQLVEAISERSTQHHPDLVKGRALSRLCNAAALMTLVRTPDARQSDSTNP